MTNYLIQFQFKNFKNCLDRELRMIVAKVFGNFLIIINSIHTSQSCKKDVESQTDQEELAIINVTRASSAQIITSPGYPAHLADSVRGELRFLGFLLKHSILLSIRLIKSVVLDMKNEYFFLQWLDLDLGYSSRVVCQLMYDNLNISMSIFN